MLAVFRRHLNSWVVRLFFMFLIGTFVLWGVGDVVRNFGNDSSVATVGGQKIEMPEMQDAYRRQLAQVTRMFDGKIEPTAEMRRSIAAQALEQVITRTAVNESVVKLGIAVPDAALRQAVYEMAAFRGPGGQFDRTTFEMVLRNNNLNETRFLDMMRTDISQRQLLEPARTGAISPETLTREVHAFQREKRVADMVALPFAAAAAPTAPTEAQLSRWYDNHLATYSTPELRRVKLVVLTPEIVGRDVLVSEAEIKAAYESRRRDFMQPERRSLQVLLVDDEAEAKRIADKWAGGAEWSTMQSEGGTPSELANATREEVPSAELAQAAFSIGLNVVPPPIRSAFGWQVVKVTAIQPGVERSLADMQGTIRGLIAADRAADLIYARSAKIEDLLAGGTPLDDLPADFGLAALGGTLDAQGNTAEGVPAPIPGGEALRAAIVQAAFAMRQDSLPHLTEGPREPEGGLSYFAVALEAVVPPAARPIAEVMEAVRADWTKDAIRHARETAAAEILAEVKAGKTLTEAALGLAVARLPAAGRASGAEGVPAQLVEPLFAMKTGEATMIETPEGFVVAVLAEIVAADPAADVAGYGQTRDALAAAIGNDIQALLTAALRNRANPKVNTAVFNTISQGE